MMETIDIIWNPFSLSDKGCCRQAQDVVSINGPVLPGEFCPRQMSKAFTRESDDAPEQPVRLQRAELPFGVKNYITPEGAQRLRNELHHLVEIERPRLANPPDGRDARRELLLLDQRIATLTQSVESAVIVEPPAGPEEQIRFGASVTVRDKSGAESTYRLVGVDETDMDRGWVSWRSPLARALLNARRGERVRFRIPAGEEELEVLKVVYETLPQDSK